MNKIFLWVLKYYEKNDYKHSLDMLLISSPSYVDYAFHILVEGGAMLKVSP